jgi:hypothetical protein
MSKALKYGFGAIALYLLVAYSTGTGTTLLEGSKGAARVVTAFQGRTVPGL